MIKGYKGVIKSDLNNKRKDLWVEKNVPCETRCEIKVVIKVINVSIIDDYLRSMELLPIL